MTRYGRLAALMRKELVQFLRARSMLALILYLYTVEIIMCTYAMSFDVRNLPTAFVDRARSAESRALVQDFGSSGYFKHNPARPYNRYIFGNVSLASAHSFPGGS